jgi:hypothetical protein
MELKDLSIWRVFTRVYAAAYSYPAVVAEYGISTSFCYRSF